MTAGAGGGGPGDLVAVPGAGRAALPPHLPGLGLEHALDRGLPGEALYLYLHYLYLHYQYLHCIYTVSTLYLHYIYTISGVGQHARHHGRAHLRYQQRIHQVPGVDTLITEKA